MSGLYILNLKAVAVFIFLVSGVFSSGVQHDQAERACTLKGGLASHLHFSPIPETVKYPPRTDIPGKSYSDLRGLALAEGESAWVSGYAEYSQPLAWNGCFQPIHGLTGDIVTDKNNTLFHCAQACANKGQIPPYEYYEYVAMDGLHCYCFVNISIFQNQALACQKGSQSVGIFHLLSHNTTREQFQCHSLETPETDASGKCSAKLNSVCTLSNVNLQTVQQCNNLTKRNCIIQEKRTWQESVKYCLEIKRRLMPYPLLEDSDNIEKGQHFWLGKFRSFIARTDKRYETTNICLSITRSDGTKRILEPNNCSLLLKAVCNNYIVGSKAENMGHTYVHVYVIAAVTMDGKYCYCFGSNIDNLNASICRKDRQYVGIFHVLSEYCLEHFQCYSYRYEPPNMECVKCSAKLKSVCTSSNVNPIITHHCNDTKKNCIIKDKRTWQKSGQHCSEINRRLLPYRLPEKLANTEEGRFYWLGAFRSFIARTEKRYETTNICLSVTRIDKTKLVLEPNNCSLLLKAVCNNYILGSKDENMGHTYVHVYVIAAMTIIIAIIVAVGVLFYFYKCRRPKKQKEDQIKTLADTRGNQYDNDYSDINELEISQKKNNSTKEVNSFVATQSTYADIEITSNEPANSEEEEYYHTATNYRPDERTRNKNKPVNVYSKCKDTTRNSNAYDTPGHSEKQHPGLAMIDCDTYNTANNADLETSNTYNVAGESVPPMGLSSIDSNTYTTTAGIGRP